MTYEDTLFVMTADLESVGISQLGTPDKKVQATGMRFELGRLVESGVGRKVILSPNNPPITAARDAFTSRGIPEACVEGCTIQSKRDGVKTGDVVIVCTPGTHGCDLHYVVI